jgi:transposase InsO family protein
MDVFSQQLADKLPPHRSGIDHKIPLKRDQNGVEESPPYGPLYGMNKEELLYLRKTLTDLLGKNFIRVSQSPAAAPILLVRKPGGGVRFCVDYRGLNERTVKDRYPLPLIRETLRNMGHARWFTKLDIIAAFHKIRIQPGEEWKTAFRTRYGLYEWNVTPFGLTGAPATFQRFINQTLQEYLDDFVSAYVDDIIIYSSGTLADHQRKVSKVLRKLKDAGLQCDIMKSEFEQDSVKYLGFIIQAEKGVHVDPKKVEAIRAWETPKSVRDVRSFIGFANFYRPFIPRFADISAPLTRLMKKDAIFKWDDDCQQAFTELKDLFINAPILAHFEEGRKTVVEADASGWATGAVLSQYGPDGQLRPCAYLSQRLSPAESNYEIHDKELLAIVRALREWRPELKMVPRFTIITDHKNLRHFGKAQHLNERQMCWADLLTEFDFDLYYRPGRLAARPDALSRRSQDMPNSITDERLTNRFRVLLKRVRIKTGRANLRPAMKDLDFEKDVPLFEEPELQAEWRKARASDMAYQRISHALLEGERRNPEPDIKTSLSECHIDDRGLLHFRQRTWIPENEALRTGIIQGIHDSHVTAHPGRDTTYSILSRRFFWPGAAKDVRRFLRNCTVCGRSSVWRDTKHGLLKPLPIPQRIWAEISVDFITGLPPSGPMGATNCMVITDRLTKSVILIGMVSITAEDVVGAFLTHFYMHHGIPLAITSDRGPQFVSTFWGRVCERLSIQRRLSTAFHPQTDGATERANQEVERILRVFSTYAQDNWKDLLPIVAVAMNNHDAASTGISPFFFTHGYHVDPIGLDKASQLQDVQTPPGMAGEMFVNRLREATDWAQAAIASAQAQQEEQTNRRRQAAPTYRKDDWVWLNLRNVRTQRPSKKLDWLHARYQVVDVPSPHTVRLNVPTGIHPVFHVDLVRPAATDPFPSQIMDDTQPPPLLVNGEEEYEVERILAVRRRKIGRGYRDEALVKWSGWARETWTKLDFVQDCAALDDFEKQHGPVQEVITRQANNTNRVVVPLMKLRLGGGYCHGPVPDTGHGLAPVHVTLAC